MGDYIPQEELEKFLAKCNSQQYSGETERAKIQPDNVGHRLLSKMGWKEGVIFCAKCRVFLCSPRTVVVAR